VLLDDPMKLPKSSAGTVRYHRDAATEARDSITLWSASRQLVPGNVQRTSWDYKSASVAQASETSIVDQGEAGNDLAQLLRDAVIDVPQAGDSWSDYERVSKARMLAHELRSANVDAVSGVRDLAVGRWFELTGHPEVDTHAPRDPQRSSRRGCHLLLVKRHVLRVVPNHGRHIVHQFLARAIAIFFHATQHLQTVATSNPIHQKLDELVYVVGAERRCLLQQRREFRRPERITWMRMVVV
jgi:hypothetical protein